MPVLKAKAKSKSIPKSVRAIPSKGVLKRTPVKARAPSSPKFKAKSPPPASKKAYTGRKRGIPPRLAGSKSINPTKTARQHENAEQVARMGVSLQRVIAHRNKDRILPLEVMLTAMDEAWDEMKRLRAYKKSDPQVVAAWYSLAVQAAEKAAPYVHAKLAAIQLVDDRLRDPGEMSDAELLKIATSGNASGGSQIDLTEEEYTIQPDSLVQ